MTKADWLACTDPRAMLGFLRGKASKRKLRLLVCAYGRSLWPWLPGRDARAAVEAGERYADGLATAAEVEDADARVLARAAELAQAYYRVHG